MDLDASMEIYEEVQAEQAEEALEGDQEAEDVVFITHSPIFRAGNVLAICTPYRSRVLRCVKIYRGSELVVRSAFLPRAITKKTPYRLTSW